MSFFLQACTSPFEFVLIDTRSFDNVHPDPSDLKRHLLAGFESNVAYDSVGGDALLVAPCPRRDKKDFWIYTHLANFVRNGSEEQESML
jgi:hypothetical protein